MAYIIGCLMAALSFLLNKALLKYVGPISIISYSPAVEEGAKTLLAYYLGADILAAHITFGVLEAVYDWRQHRQELIAPLLSVGGHTLFGLATVAMFSLTGRIWLALAAGLIIHVIWNTVIVTIYAPEKGRKR